MKTQNPQSTPLKNTVELKTNTIGNTQMNKNRDDAKNALNEAQSQEAQKLKQGFKWMISGKTIKLVHPDLILIRKNEGFKPVTQ